MPKLWVDKKLYSVEGEVRDYAEKLEMENDKLREGAAKLAKLTAEMQTINVELSEKYEKLEQAAKKVASCFPDKIPEGQETIAFNIPAYIIEELKQALSEQK